MFSAACVCQQSYRHTYLNGYPVCADCCLPKVARDGHFVANGVNRFVFVEHALQAPQHKCLVNNSNNQLAAPAVSCDNKNE